MKCLVAVPTFRRPKFLGRILACFDRLDHGDKKLVIINDGGDVNLKYNGVLDVEVVNVDTHLPLAVKRNMFACWDFDLLFPLDDDDLFLPSRLKNHIDHYEKDQSIDLYRNRLCYVANDRVIKITPHSAFTNSSFTRKGFFKSGGYTNFSQSNQDDVELRKNFVKYCNCKMESDFSNIDFVYQFESGRYHNTHNTDPIMGTEFLSKTDKVEGDFEIIPDYKSYESVLDVVENVKDSPLKMKIIDNLYYNLVDT